MKTSHKILAAGFLFFCCVTFIISIVSAADCGCGEPDWGDTDPSDDPGWGSSFDDLTGGGGSSTDTGGAAGGSGASADSSPGGTGDSSSSDSSGSSGSSDTSGSSSSSGNSGSTAGGSSEEGVVWRMKADDLAGKGLYNESLEAYNRSITYDPYTVRSWMGKGRVLLSLDRPSEAAEAFTRALRLDPGNTDALTLLGDARNATGNYDGAIESYAKALAMNPNLAGIKDRITQTEMAKTAISTPPTPEITATPVETAVISNPTATNGTVQTSSSDTPAAPPTLSAPFPGISVILLACGAGLLLFSGRRK
jgi:hypothetical protein